MQSMKMVNLKDLVVSKTNPRRTFDKKQLSELTESIRTKGVVQPILIRPLNGAFEIVSGERRYRAAKEADLKDIPAMIRDLDDQSAMEIQVIENLHRSDVHPLEEAEGYELLMKQKAYSGIDDLVTKIGKSRSYIYGRLKLCALVPEGRKSFYEGELSASIALLVSRIPAAFQKEALKEILHGWNGPKGYKDAKQYLEKKFMAQLAKAPFDPKDATLCPKAGACTSCPKRTGSSPDLFPDIKRTDICTDMVCFKLKKEAHFDIKIAKAKESGQQVLKTKDVFDSVYGDSIRHGFVDVDNKCWEDNKSRTYKQLLAKTDKQPALVLDPNGEVREVIQKSVVLNAAKEYGLIENTGSRDSQSLAAAKKENRVINTLRAFWIEKIRKAATQRWANAVALAEVLYHLGSSYAEEIVEGKIKDADDYGNSWDVVKLYQLGDKQVQELMVSALKKKLDIMDDEELDFICKDLGFTVLKDFVITQDYLNAMTKDDLLKLIKELGIDVTIDADSKKTSLVKVILDHAPKGKVPAELVLKKGKK